MLLKLLNDNKIKTAREASSIDNENQTKARLQGSTHLKSTKSVVFKWTS